MLIRPTPDGPYCEAGAFHIDPWGRVDRAIITHAHSDHARWGSKHYLCTPTCAPILRERLGAQTSIEVLPYGEVRQIGSTKVSLHPAGHVLGSAQVRIEHRGEVWVVSGDYKLDHDPSCEAFEPVLCDTFITESTFGLPIYRWPQPEQVLGEMLDWWKMNAARGRACVISAYPLGKTQRLLGMLATAKDLPGPVAVHGSGARLSRIYLEQGRPILDAAAVTADTMQLLRGTGLLIASPAVLQGSMLRRLGEHSTAFASGWMRIRGIRRRRAMDRGFIISDHVDWPSLLEAIKATGASRIGVTHGYTAQLVRYLSETGLNAYEFPTRYTGEPSESDEEKEETGGAREETVD